MRMKKTLALVLVLALALALAVPALAADNSGSDVRLLQTEGTVTVTSSSGKEQSTRENMRLYNGYVISTSAASYAWITLDESKAVKLDASSSLEVRRKGKELELLLMNGAVYFNVTAPLKEEEKLNIRTASMVTGVRGTTGWIAAVNRNRTLVNILEGLVQCTVTDTASGESQQTSVAAGEAAELNVNPDPETAEGEHTEVNKITLGEEDIPGSVLVEVVEDPALISTIAEATDGAIDLRGVTQEQAQQKQEEEETQAAQVLQELEDETAGQEEVVAAFPVNDPTSPATEPELPDTPVPATVWHTVTWANWDGTVLKTERYAQGATPAYSGDPPTKPEDGETAYVFEKWSPDLAPVSAAATYTAVFTPTAKTYALTVNVEPDTEGLCNVRLVTDEDLLSGNTQFSPLPEAFEAEQSVMLFMSWNSGYSLQSLTLTREAGGAGPALSFGDDGDPTGPDYSYNYSTFWFTMPEEALTLNVVLEATSGESGETGGDHTVTSGVDGTYCSLFQVLPEQDMEELPLTVASGTEVTLTALYEDSCAIRNLAVTGASGDAVTLGDTSVDQDGHTLALTFTFTMPAENVTVTADFVSAYPVTAEFTPEGAAQLSYTGGIVGENAAVGDTVSFKLNLNEGYDYPEVFAPQLAFADDRTDTPPELSYSEATGEYSFTMPDGPIKVIADLVAKQYTISRVYNEACANVVTMLDGKESDSAAKGDTVTVQLVLNSTEYTLTKLTAILSDTPEASVVLTPVEGQNMTYTMVMPAGNVEITMDVEGPEVELYHEFNNKCGSVVLRDGEGNVLIPSENLYTVKLGSRVTLEATPDADFDLAEDGLQAMEGSVAFIREGQLADDGVSRVWTFYVSEGMQLRTEFTSKS